MRNESFDLVLLDWHLPDIDGDDVVLAARQYRPAHPGHFPDQPLQRGRPGRRRAGADDYIVAIAPLELLARVAAPAAPQPDRRTADESFDVANYRVEPPPAPSR